MRQGKKDKKLLKVSALLPLLLAPSLVVANNINFYGQVNRAYLQADDGVVSRGYFVDNDASGSRLGAKASASMGAGCTLSGKLEYGISSATSTNINQGNNASGNSLGIRHADVSMAYDRFGTFSLGHGSEAADGTFESSLADTFSVSYASVGDLAGGIHFHQTGPLGVGNARTTDPSVGDVFWGIDGGDRADRVRYDTPEFMGFSLALSLSNTDADPLADQHALARFTTSSQLGLFFNKEFSGMKLSASFGKTKVNRSNTDFNKEKTVGSAALLHVGTGLNLAFSAATDSARQGSGSVKSDPKASMGYVQLGKQSNFMPYGKTNVAIDYAISRNRVARTDKGRSFGIGVVQKLDKLGAEVYTSLRKLNYNVKGDASQARLQYDSVTQFVLGAKINFAKDL